MMKGVFSVALAFLATSVLLNVQAQQSMDGLDDYLKISQVVMNTWIRLIAAIGFMTADPTNPFDAITLTPFTLDHAINGWFTHGNSSTYNSVLSGLLGMTRELTLNKTSGEVVMNIRIPLATFTGSYEIDVTEGLCTPFGCAFHYWKGNGSYEHKFGDVEIGLNYTLGEEDGRIQIQHTRADLNFLNCTLFAENYFIDNKLQEGEEFEKLSRDLKIRFNVERDTYRVMLAESASWALNVDWGLRRLSLEDTMLDLELYGGATVIE